MLSYVDRHHLLMQANHYLLRSSAQRLADASMRDYKYADNEIFCSKESRNIPETSKPVWSWISRKPVGLVTFTSVSQSPMTSRPIRCSPLFESTGPSAAAISRWRSVTG